MKRIPLVFALCIAIISNSISAQIRYVTYNYKGTIGTDSIVLKFFERDLMYNWYQGTYYYTKHHKDIEFRGKYFGDADFNFESPQKLTESVNGKNTGYFIFNQLSLGEQSLLGKWYTMDGKKSFSVILTFINTE